MGRFYEDIRVLGGTVSIGTLTSSNINNVFEVSGTSSFSGGMNISGSNVSKNTLNYQITDSIADPLFRVYNDGHAIHNMTVDLGSGLDWNHALTIIGVNNEPGAYMGGLNVYVSGSNAFGGFFSNALGYSVELARPDMAGFFGKSGKESILGTNTWAATFNQYQPGGRTYIGADTYGVLIYGASTSSSTIALDVRDTLNQALFRVRDDGNVGIGTDTPGNKLEVSGTVSTTGLKITSGASNGYILQSDASGNATWISATSASSNFANTNLNFTSNRAHNTNGYSFEVTTDNGGFSAGFLYFNNTQKAEYGFGNSYTDWRSTSVDHYLSGVKRLEILSLETVFNNTGANYDFRVEGDTDQNLFFLDASTDGIAIGTSTTFTGIKATINTNSSSKYLGLNIDANSYTGTFNYGLLSNAQSSNATYNIGIESRPLNGISEDIGFRAQLSGTTTTKKGLSIDITGNGLSNTNYGIYVSSQGASSLQYGYYTSLSGTYSSVNYGYFAQVSGASSQQYGFYANVTGTSSNTNYGSYTSLQLGNNGGYGNYITLSGDSSSVYYGQYIFIGQNTGTSSTNNTGSYLRMMGDGGFNIGSRIECKYGILSNIAVAAVSGSAFAYTVGDIALYAMVADDAQLTSYPSEAGRFDNRSKTTGNSYGVNIIVNGTYSSSNVGLSISSLPTLGGPNNAISTQHGHNIFNEIGGDYDFRIEGDTDQNLFFVDASTDNIGIGTNTPGAKLDVRGSSIFNEDGGNFDFRVEGDTETHLIFADASADNVGIGTNLPSGRLHVKVDSEGDPALVVDGLNNLGIHGKNVSITKQADTTTTGTNTSTIASISLLSTEQIVVEGRVIANASTGDSVTVGGRFTAVAQNVAGTVTIIGVDNSIIFENSAGSPSFNVVSGTNAIDITVTGGGENLSWLVTYTYEIIAPPAA